MLKKILPILIIFSVWLAIFLANFPFNTWLSGWDNLHPEFNFSANIQRSVFAVWQEYQGLGLLGGMGHAADLPRQLLLLTGSWILPANSLRPLYFFAMLLIGPLGVYFLLREVREVRDVGAVGGGLFYLLNLATVQTFYTAFEPFATHYGFLPWLIFIALRLVKEFNRRNLALFVLINLLAVPQGYIPTVFVVYLLALVVTLTGAVLSKQGKIKNALGILGLTFVINAFWLLPFLYFTATNVRVTVEAKMNVMATEETFLRNRAYGNILDVILLRGFWFDLTEQGKYVLEPWRSHLENPAVVASGVIIFGIVLLGLIVSFKEKNPYRWVWLGLLILPFTLLANNTPPFSWADVALYKIPLFAQVFRSPFTKFSVLLALTFSFYFNYAVGKYTRSFKVTYILILGVLIFYSWPIFQGNLFFKNEKLKIPAEYFAVFDYFKQQDKNSRIGRFPAQTFWGWDFYRWGYSGSGFLWYGIDQPILDRAFDVWSRENENYYWEMSYALYSQNWPLFESVLEKYRINWLLVDGNVINPSSPKALFLEELEEGLARLRQGSGEARGLPKVELAAEFGPTSLTTDAPELRGVNKIKIYRVNLRTPGQNFVSLADNLPEAEPYELGNLNHLEFAPDKIWPYVDVHRRIEINPTAKEATGGGAFSYPNLPHDQGYLITVKARNIFGRPFLFWLENLNSRRADMETYLPKSQQKTLLSESFLARPRANTFVPSLSRMILNLKNLFVKRGVDPTGVAPASPDLTDISYFIQPPMEPDGLGYTLHFDSPAVGKEESKNELGEINVYPLDFWKMVKERREVGEVGEVGGSRYLSKNEFVVEHPNPAFYRIDLAPKTASDKTTLILSQSFDPGWVGVGIGEISPTSPFGLRGVKEIRGHTKINNWANGWELTGDERIVYLFYWPQLLEFAGFGVLTIFILGLIIKTASSKSVFLNCCEARILRKARNFKF